MTQDDNNDDRLDKDVDRAAAPEPGSRRGDEPLKLVMICFILVGLMFAACILFPEHTRGLQKFMQAIGFTKRR